jgi:uncharacterized iron-regulated membrane protein
MPAFPIHPTLHECEVVMTHPDGPPAATTEARPAAGDFYRAVWRWHFYAGLLVLPFLIWLALTGGLYVFKAQIDGYVHRQLKVVPVSGTPHAHGELLATALRAHPGTAGKYTLPAAPGQTAEVGIATARGERLSVYVDPYRAQVVGALPSEGSVAWTIRKLHSLKYFGPVPRGAIEIAAGWAILLVLTGVYLWWPRGRKGGVVTVRATPAKRVFWRDLHAVTGIFVGALLLFLAVTGMPWSVLWGAQVNQWANGSNFGYPAGVRVQVPMSGQRLAADTHPAWSLQQAQVPQSGHEAHEGHDGHEGHPAEAPQAPLAAHALDLDAAIAAFDGLGITPGYTVQLPKGPQGVYTASIYPAELSQQRVIHLDAYSGKPLIDMGYADYGPLGRLLEWGINVHLGQEFGVANQAVLVLACLGIVLLCVSAGVMWWKRRPAGRLGVPPQPANPRAQRVVLALLVLGGIAFPLVGASLLVIAALDWLAFGRQGRAVSAPRSA